MRKALLKQVVMPASSVLTPFKSWSYMKKLCEDDYQPLQRQRMKRMGLIRELLAHAYRETMLYRSQLDRANVDPVEVSYPRTFARVPVTSKNVLREGFPDRHLARSHRNAWLRYSNTSGTTGRPLLLVQDTRDISYKYASILRSRCLAGVDPLGSQLRLTPNECQPCLPNGDSPQGLPSFDQDGKRASLFLLMEKQLINPLFHQRHMLEPFWQGPDDKRSIDYDSYLRQIDDFQPEILTIYPVYAMLLAKHIRRTGQAPPRISGVVDFSGGLCTPRMREFISEYLGVRTAQGCGGCEFARYGASCPDDPDRMHVAETYCFVEAVRADGSHCASGELGNIIVTSLHSWAMPIIRLEPGDVGSLIEEPCRCGRRSRRIEHGGRLQALIRNADGRWVSARESWDKLWFVKGLQLFQLVQHSTRKYVMRVIPEPGMKIDRDQLNSVLEDLLGKTAKVNIEEVSHLQAAQSGKLQLVKSNTFEEFRPHTARHQKVPVN